MLKLGLMARAAHSPHAMACVRRSPRTIVAVFNGADSRSSSLAGRPSSIPRQIFTGREALAWAIQKHLHRKNSDSIFADGVGSQAFGVKGYAASTGGRKVEAA